MLFTGIFVGFFLTSYLSLFCWLSSISPHPDIHFEQIADRIWRLHRRHEPLRSIDGQDPQTEGNGEELNEETRQSDNETESAEEEKPRYVRNDSVDSDEDAKLLEEQEIENEVSRLVNGSDAQVTSRILVREEEVEPAVAVNEQDPLADEPSTPETSDGEEFDLRMRTIDLLTQAVGFFFQI